MSVPPIKGKQVVRKPQGHGRVGGQVEWHALAQRQAARLLVIHRHALVDERVDRLLGLLAARPVKREDQKLHMAQLGEGRRQGSESVNRFGGPRRGRHLLLVALRAGDETERAGLLLDLPAESKTAKGSRDPHAKHSRGISVYSLVLSQVCQMCSTRQFSDSSSILIIREPRHTRPHTAARGPGQPGPGGETSHGCP